MSTYLETTYDVYREAAHKPQASLCCTTSKPYAFPGLVIPKQMLEMNYGCGTTIHIQDLRPDMTILYVGVGGGMEALQFAYFTRRPGSVIAVDSVPEMLEKARKNLEIAAEQNPWFDPSFVILKEGNALDLPIADDTVDLAAQNCLFNIFVSHDLEKALREIHRVLRKGGMLSNSDPISETPIPDHLRADERLRAQCLSGAISLNEYVNAITNVGFGIVEIRGRRPYRILDQRRFDVPEDILLESVEVTAYKDTMPNDGPCVFTGRTVFYTGDEACFDDGNGHTVIPDVPLTVCDKTARWFEQQEREDIFVTPSTYHYGGGGCC